MSRLSDGYHFKKSYIILVNFFFLFLFLILINFAVRNCVSYWIIMGMMERIIMPISLKTFWDVITRHDILISCMRPHLYKNFEWSRDTQIYGMMTRTATQVLIGTIGQKLRGVRVVF